MIDSLLDLLGLGSSLELLSISEVLVVLLLAILVVVSASVGLATVAVALRSRTVSRAKAASQRLLAWQQALHAVLYDGASADSLLDQVDTASIPYFLDMLLQYVRRLDGDERDRVCKLAEPYLSRTLGYLDHRSETRRMRAVQMLGELGLGRYSDRVIGALDDRSPLVAMVAASTLARDETPEYAREVLARLHRFSHWRRDFLTAMLASMGAGATPALRATLVDGEALEGVRTAAADALALLSDPLAADPAREALSTTSDVELRAACLRLLASVGRAEHLTAVREWTGAHEPLPVRLAALRALGRFGGPSDLPLLEAAARDDPSPWVAIAAARALKEGGGEEALEALAGSEHPRAALGLQVISEARSW